MLQNTNFNGYQFSWILVFANSWILGSGQLAETSICGNIFTGKLISAKIDILNLLVIFALTHSDSRVVCLHWSPSLYGANHLCEEFLNCVPLCRMYYKFRAWDADGKYLSILVTIFIGFMVQLTIPILVHSKKIFFINFRL